MLPTFFCWDGWFLLTAGPEAFRPGLWSLLGQDDKVFDMGFLASSGLVNSRLASQSPRDGTFRVGTSSENTCPLAINSSCTFFLFFFP